MNTELFRKINDIIQPRPGKLFMGNWEEGTGCGTTRCVAGWAIYLETGAPLYDLHSGELSPETRALAERLNVADDIEIIGGALLGLDVDQRQLFYVDNDEALMAVAEAAAGDEQGFMSVLSEARVFGD